MAKAAQQPETDYTGYTDDCRSEYLILRDILTLGKPSSLRCDKDPNDHPRSENPVKAQGLCLNCADRHVCRHPSLGRNVIYCESYI